MPPRIAAPGAAIGEGGSEGLPFYKAGGGEGAGGVGGGGVQSTYEV